MTAGPVVLYENGPTFVFDKPAGLPTQAPWHIESLETQMRAWLTERDRPEYPQYVGLVHRLDRCVTGAILMCSRIRPTRKLGKQFERRTVRKTYWAILEGDVAEPSGEWLDHVRKIPDVAQAEIVPPDHPDARDARLSYTVLGRGDGWTWLEIELQTGRTHQIRIQTSSRGHPVWGDGQYGSTRTFGPPTDDHRLRPIALHARAIEFEDPSDSRRVSVTAPLPATWEMFALGVN